MSRSPVARRYAQAMVELADADGSHAALRKTFGALTSALLSVPESIALLSDPTVAKSARAKMLSEIMGQLQISGPIANLAKLMLDKGRFAVLADVHASFEEMLDARTGRVTAEVTSAVPLDAAAQDKLVSTLAKRLGKEVVIETSTDPALIGGLVIKVGNTIYDASVKNQLGRLREQLTSSHVG
ncbi:MAG: F0F1 ATP synthase subunit delta [Myxococcales bacterium]|nr:F0F1 ATP synthase subunit delta [Myxococcales bacterium]